MKTKTIERILSETPQETKDKVRETANEMVGINPQTFKIVLDKRKQRKDKAIEYYKEYVEGIPLTQDEVIQSFYSGFLCREKEVNKVILDKLNKLRSDLSNEQKVKLTKVISKDKIESLKLQIELLIEIQNKLK